MKCMSIKCINNKISQEDQKIGTCLKAKSIKIDELGFCSEWGVIKNNPPTEEYKEYLDQYEQQEDKQCEQSYEETR